MFGFNPIASAPFSSPTLIILANAYISAVPQMTSAMGVLNAFDAAGSVVLPLSLIHI